jgi:hypothetical protein
MGWIISTWLRHSSRMEPNIEIVTNGNISSQLLITSGSNTRPEGMYKVGSKRVGSAAVRWNAVSIHPFPWKAISETHYLGGYIFCLSDGRTRGDIPT